MLIYNGKGPRHQRGVGLIEVLIAVLVLSIGMLGMAGLQAWSLRNNQSALQRGQASVQLYYIADVMRADRDTAIAGGYNITLAAADPAGTTFPAKSRAQWRTSIRNQLGPGASGAVACVAAGGGTAATCTVTVRWDDSRAQRGSATQDLSIEVYL